jgi:exosortase/archaeosortase family protein
VAGIFLLSLFPTTEAWAVQATTNSLGFILRLFADSVRVTSPFVHANGVLGEILPECTTLLPTLALVAAIAAYPASPAWKIVGILGGIVILWIFNVMRLVALMVLLMWNPKFSRFAHVYFFQTLTLMLISSLFSIWIFQQQRRGK